MTSYLYQAANPPFIVPIFLPEAGCPHRYIFCNQAAITGRKTQILSPKAVENQIRTFLQYKGKSRKHVQIAFFGGNFLGLDETYIRRLLSKAAQFVKAGQVHGIRFSTRPDTICDRLLDLIAPFPVETVEIGAQSMDDHVLALSGRGHLAADTEKAICRLKARGYDVGIQLMVGLPGDNEKYSRETGEKIVALAPAFVRIYPTLVFAHSMLAKWYRTGKYKPLPLAPCVRRVKKLYLQFDQAGIRVVRMGLQPTTEMEGEHVWLAGPYHPAFGHLVHSEIFFDRVITAFEKLDETRKKDSKPLLIHVNPRDISKLRGLKNHNIIRLKRRYPMQSFKVFPDVTLSSGCISIN